MAELINFEQTTVTNDIDADGKWGLLARTGEWIRKPEFRSISVFDPNDNSLARVKSDSGWGVIRPDGSWLIEPKFEALGRLYNGLAAARLEGKFGFVEFQVSTWQNATANSASSILRWNGSLTRDGRAWANISGMDLSWPSLSVDGDLSMQAAR